MSKLDELPSRACESHSPEALTQEDWGGARNLCKTCVSRICLRCLNAKGSWMSGLCNDCYSITEREQKVEQREYERQRRQEQLADAWDAGRNSSPDALNPFTEALA